MMILLFLFLTVAAPVHSEPGDQSEVEDVAQVEFRETSVVLTCPHNPSDEVKWLHGNEEIKDYKNNIYEIQAPEGTATGFYTCQKNEKKHYFFIKARGEDTHVCEMNDDVKHTHNLLSVCVSV
ncbi:hypothetical protein IRJ41_001950 [Triplophysa rosa]|uniref:Ig-like domain-containing protein n=1 Tax=Triplophysa rosa TaxID=992332 RepID=A0A9W7WIL7_TRIRA|nr:hypothetical protein IRJ41_001950 [Triplophysa rosa]